MAARHWTGLDAAFKELEAELTDITRGLTVRVFNGVLSKTPQYEGRMAASWTYCIGTAEFYNRSASFINDTANGVHTELGYYKIGVEPRRRGDPEAMNIAKAASAGRDRAFKLGDRVILTNGVDHGEGAYAGPIEDGNIQLRAENQLGRPAQRTVDWAGTFYADTSPAKAATLKSLTIGANDTSSD